MIYSTEKLKDLENFARNFVKTLPPRCVLLLEGPMAAGKTTFVHMLTQGEASSPTYNLHHTYFLGEQRIEHFDLYRLENADEIESSGLYEILDQPGNQWVIIEWPERDLLQKQKDLTYLLGFSLNPRQIVVKQL